MAQFVNKTNLERSQKVRVIWRVLILPKKLMDTLHSPMSLRCFQRNVRRKYEICFLVCVENTYCRLSTLQSFFVEGYQTKDLNMNTASDG